MLTQVLTYSGLIAGALVIMILILYRDVKKSNNWLLGISLLCVWYGLFINNLNVTGQMFNYPYLFRTANIANYLTFPLLYLYLRNSFYPGIKWRKKDWIIFVPALLYVIDMLPLFFASSEYKIAVMKLVLSNFRLLLNFSEGWLFPSGFHLVFLYLWALLFYILKIRLLLRNRNYDYGMSAGQNRSLYFFMVVLNLLFFPLIIPGIFGVVFQLSWYNLSFINLDFAITLLAAAVYLLLSPKVLYGFFPAVHISHAQQFHEQLAGIYNDEPKELAIAPEQPPVYPANVKTLSNEAVEKMISTVENYLAEQRPYLKTGYTIHDLSRNLSIPVYHLSPIINQHFGTNFNSWLNKFRVAYFIGLLEDEINRQLTLEALAQKAGFSSRATFISAFKKEKGCTPSAYLKNNMPAEF